MSGDCFSETLLHTLMTRLPGAGSDAIKLEMGNAAREFFLESGAWHELVYANLKEGITTYTLIPDAGTVGMICELIIDGRKLKPTSNNIVPEQSWRGTYQCRTDFGTIENLSPVPSKTIPKGISANVIVVPDSCGCDIPEGLISHYFEALLDASLHRLYSHVNRPYTNLTLSSFHVGRYRAHLTRARKTVASGNARAGGPWVYPQIAPGRRRGPVFPRGA